MTYYKLILIILFTYTASIGKHFTPTEGPGAEASSIWEKIEPFFSPPEEFEGRYGEYRTPLKFYDGRSVNTPLDWQERREEIRGRWHEMMG
ncbi:MAG: hypothetical protein WD625_02705, partial [Balneolales bacterium]